MVQGLDRFSGVNQWPERGDSLDETGGREDEIGGHENRSRRWSDVRRDRLPADVIRQSSPAATRRISQGRAPPRLSAAPPPVPPEPLVSALPLRAPPRRFNPASQGACTHEEAHAGCRG